MLQKIPKKKERACHWDAEVFRTQYPSISVAHSDLALQESRIEKVEPATISEVCAVLCQIVYLFSRFC